MKTIAILNLKGGVAKTTTVINTAAVLARDHGKKVLVIDADSQCNLTEFFLNAPTHATLAELLRSSRLTNPEWLVHCTEIEGVDIIPADDALMDLDLSAVGAGKADAMAISTGLAKLRMQYDFCLIDCPPAFNAASAAALAAADEVLIPIKLDAFSLRGMGNLMRQVKNMRKINSDLQIAGILPTMYYRSEQSREAKRILSASNFRLYSPIRRSDKVDYMTYEQQPLCLCSPKSGPAVDYRRFVRELIGE